MGMFANMFSGLGSAIVGGIGSLLGGKSSQDAAKEQLQQQEAYQTQMSNTAYQRASTDMKAAGLNPMMMFGGGSAASTPSAPSAQTGQLGQGISQATSSAMTAAIANKTIDKLTEEIANTKADTAKIVGDTIAPNYKSQNVFEDSRVKHTTADINIARGPQVALDSDIANHLRTYYGNSAAAEILKMGQAGKDISNFISPATSIFNSGLSAAKTFRGSWADRVDRGFTN